MKQRRDITLGEMQDECKRFTDGLCGGKSCAYQDLCNQMKSGYTPHAWDLTDPPRFNEQQMAAIRKSYESGVLSITRHDGMVCYQLNDFMISLTDNGIVNLLEIGETLDLAELLGKDEQDGDIK